MFRINHNYTKLKSGYLFPEIGRRVAEFQKRNPEAKIIRLGIGDVTLPLAEAVAKAGEQAFAAMKDQQGFKGYGPEQGYEFLREAIAQREYQSRGVTISADEIFISDGAKCDTGNIQEIFGDDCVVGIPDPVYPVYHDTSVMAGRRIVLLPCFERNGFLPELPKEKVDVIYLCFPNNPTGVTAGKDQLKLWVDYARANDAVILFDAAYESFITDPQLPHSIFEIEGARECALEFRSFSKKAGFTGTRCAFTVIPKELAGRDENGHLVFLHQLWLRRQTTKFNGVSYPVQRAAAACYSPEGIKQIAEQTVYYLENARLIRESLMKLGFVVFGGVNAPYIWFKSPKSKSWDYFDVLLTQKHIVTTPGAGFGVCGEGFMRLSAFGAKADIEDAMERMKSSGSGVDPATKQKE